MAAADFASRPWRVRAWVAVVIPLGCALPILLTTWPSPVLRSADLWTAAALILGSVLNVELGRRLEGGKVFQQRPHKALSAWPMAALFLLPLIYIIPIVAVSYAHARWRGVRVTLWKWIASASFLMTAGAVAGVVTLAGDGGPPTLFAGLNGALLAMGAVVVFLTVETTLLGVTGLLNTGSDDAWLRRTLVDPWFYLMEAGVLALGALTGLIGASAPWFLPLLIPAFWFLQQSVLQQPLREQATRDPKTGLLHFAAWEAVAQEEIRRLGSGGGSWAVLFADIDNFRNYNQRHGHLGGDSALNLVAGIITTHVRPRDLVARFGGEEFCVLLPGTVPGAAELVAERLRVAIKSETSALAEAVTVSIGVAAVQPGHPPMQLDEALTLADQALYQAKLEGRDTVRLHLPEHLDGAGQPDPADSRSGDTP